MITRYLLIFSIAIPGLVARTVSWDTKYADVEIDQKIVYKQDIIRCLDDESVRLSGLNFIEIPNHIVKSDAIKAISLDDNDIVELPANVFDEVPNLQCLNLAKNNIPYERLFGFRHNKLKTLIFDDNPKRGQTMFSNFEPIRYSIPPAGSYFPNLESLSLNNVNFENFPSHFNESFPRLSTLYITDNGLQFLNDNIFSILPSNLKGLHLERNNFTSLILRDAGNIEELYFDGNPLVSFKIGPGSSTIKLISLANCTLNPRDQFQIQVPLLTTLDLSYNRLTTIPYQGIPQLEKLSLSHNEFTSVPNLGYLQKLHSLSLSHNIIEYINDEIMQLLPESLQKLSLRGNRINSIDDMAFSTFSMLEELDLSKNKLRSLPAVWAKNLKMLRHLNLKSNFFATIADMSISSLISLRALYIEENMVTFIDENSLQLVPKLCTVYVR